MFNLGFGERKALLFLALLILVVSSLQFLDVSLKKPAFSQMRCVIGPVNINTASESELTGLKGIGKVKAGRIVEYRNNYGLFKTLEDLQKVKGIGEYTAARLKNNIRF